MRSLHNAAPSSFISPSLYAPFGYQCATTGGSSAWLHYDEMCSHCEEDYANATRSMQVIKMTSLESVQARKATLIGLR
jgi:hypothetical protein